MIALILGEEIKKCLLSLLLVQKEFSAERRLGNAKHAKHTSRLLAGTWAESSWRREEVWNWKLSLW